MKHHRFIQLLGEEAEAVGVDIAELIEEVGATEAVSDIPDEWATSRAVAQRMQRELPRRLSERLHGRKKDGIEFVARTLETAGAELEGERADFGIVFEVDLPGYQVVKGVLARPVALAARTDRSAVAPAELSARANAMLEQSPSSFILAFPVDGSVKVVPAQAVAAAARAGESIPKTFPEAFYMKGLERFFQDLGRCFIGDQGLIPGKARGTPEDPEQRYQEFLDEQGLSTLLYVRVQQGDRDARLNEF